MAISTHYLIYMYSHINKQTTTHKVPETLTDGLWPGLHGQQPVADAAEKALPGLTIPTPQLY